MSSTSRAREAPPAYEAARKLVPFTAEQIREMYEQGHLTETGRDHMLMEIGEPVEATRGATIKSTLERLAAGEITVKGAKATMARLGYNDLVLDRFPEILAEPPTRRRHWWKLTMPEPWATFLESGAINVITYTNSPPANSPASQTNPLFRKTEEGKPFDGNRIKFRDGKECPGLPGIVRQGELIEVNGRMYRCVGNVNSVSGHGSGTVSGNISSVYYGTREIVQAEGTYISSDHRLVSYTAGGFIVDGYNLVFNGKLAGKNVRHIPDVLVGLAHADPNAHKNPYAGQGHGGLLVEQCQCWFISHHGLVVEPVDDDGTDEDDEAGEA